MQKNWCLTFLFLLIFLVGFVVAASGIDQVADSIDNKVQDVTSQVDTAQKTITNQQLRDAYLKKQWISLLETKPVLKQIIEGYRKVSPYSDPILNYVVGMAPELSLFFILVMVIWFFLVKYYFTIYEVLKDLSTFSNLASAIISLSIFCILVILNFFQSLSILFANYLVKLTEFLTSPVMKVIAFIIFVLVILFLSKFSKQVKVLVRYIRMQRHLKENEGKLDDVSKKVSKIAKSNPSKDKSAEVFDSGSGSYNNERSTADEF
jgi:hypothetical protein